MHVFRIFVPVVMLLTLSISTLQSQEEYPYPSLSPKATLTQEVGNTIITMEYERPCARNRKIWGELVPWNKVWRMGAGYCTKISFDQQVRIGGKDIEAGKYSVFAIPNPDKWVIILNSDTTLYGSWYYESGKDVVRFNVSPSTSNRFYEALTYDIDVIPNNARLYFSWLNTQVSFDIETSTDKNVQQFVSEELLTKKNPSVDNYALAADYYYYQGTDLKTGLEVATIALEMDEKLRWARSVKILLLEKLTRYDEALKEIEILRELINAETYEKEKYRQDELDTLLTIEKRIVSKI